MLSYTIRRVLMAVPTLWFALTMIFILVTYLINVGFRRARDSCLG